MKFSLICLNGLFDIFLQLEKQCYNKFSGIMVEKMVALKRNYKPLLRVMHIIVFLYESTGKTVEFSTCFLPKRMSCLLLRIISFLRIQAT